MGTIRTEQTRLLQDNGTENIEFFVYDKDGVAKTTLNQTKDVLKQIPSNLSPINSNLSVEYLRPLRDAIKTTTSEDSQLLNKNPNFRYGSFNWDIGSVSSTALAEVALPSQVFAGINPITGIYCLIQNVVPNTAEKTNYMIKNILSKTPIISGEDLEISYNYYFFTLGFFVFNVQQYISVGLDSTNDGTINKMYDFDENRYRAECSNCGENNGAIAFTDDRFFKKIDIRQFDFWNKSSTTIQCNLSDVETNPHIEVKLFRTTKGQGLTDPKMIYDGLAISQQTSAKKRQHTKRKGAIFTFIDGNITVADDNITGEYKQEETMLSNEINLQNTNSIFGTFARKDRPLSLQQNTLDKCILQEFINDYRTPIKRYEGEFYKDDSDVVPIYFYHKLWVNFGTAVLQEPVSCIIDSLEYNVKQNTYNIIMHIPNADDDIISYDTYKLS